MLLWIVDDRKAHNTNTIIKATTTIYNKLVVAQEGDQLHIREVVFWKREFIIAFEVWAKIVDSCMPEVSHSIHI